MLITITNEQKVLVTLYPWESPKLYTSDFELRKGDLVVVAAEHTNEIGVVDINKLPKLGFIIPNLGFVAQLPLNQKAAPGSVKKASSKSEDWRTSRVLLRRNRSKRKQS